MIEALDGLPEENQHSDGVPLVEVLPEYRERFVELCERIAGFKMEN